MTVPIGLIKDVSADATRALTTAGWEKRKAGFSLDLRDKLYGFLGLNKAVGRGTDEYLEINPIVGVGSHDLEKLVAKSVGRKWQPYEGAAIASNIGYLTPEKKYRSWIFQAGDSITAQIDDMVSTIEKYGRPFIMKHADLSALVDGMGNGGLGGPFDQLRIPAALVLLNQPDKAESYLEKELTSLGDRRDANAEIIRQFASKLRQSIKHR